MTIQYKAMPVTQFKVLDEAQGIVSTLVSVTGIEDEVRDIIEPGAYQKTLIARNPKGCWSHNWDEPVSKTLEARELLPGDPELPGSFPDGTPWPAEAGALKIKTQFNMAGPRGLQAFADVQFFGPDQEWCVDEATEILTDRGWLSCFDVTVDDEAYVIDPETLEARFEPILDVRIWPAQKRQMRHIETGSHSSLTTMDHRWLVRQRVSNDKYEMVWRPTRLLTQSSAILRSAQRSDAPSEAKWSDSFVELIGWFWTEGNMERSACHIGQSLDKNPTHVGAIRAALKAVFPAGWSERIRSNGMADFRIGKECSKAILSVTGEHKAPTSAFLMSLTHAQLLLLIERCLDGDEHRTKPYVDGDGYQIQESRKWYQVEDHSVRTFEMACALAGVSTNTYPGGDYGRAPQNVALLRSGVSNPVDAVRVARLRTGEPSKKWTARTDEVVEHEGIVWCPRTPSMTWLARRKGSVYFTGNSIGYEVPVGGSKVDPKTGVRHIKTLDLYEYSPVLWGAMPFARSLGAKGLGKDTEPVREVQEAFKALKADAGTTPHEFRGEADLCEACGEADGTKGHVVPDESHVVVEGDPTGVDDSAPAVDAAAKALEPDEPVSDDEPAVEDDITEALERAKALTAELAPQFTSVAKDDDGNMSVSVDDAGLKAAVSERVASKGFYILASGSYEERFSALNSAVSEWVRAQSGRGYSYASIEATYDDSVVFQACIYDRYDDARSESFYQASYTFADGAATLGDVLEVSVDVSVSEKAARRSAEAKMAGWLVPALAARAGGVKSAAVLPGADAKAGRVLSSTNSTTVLGAVEALLGVLDVAGVDHGYARAVSEAAGKESEVDTETETDDAVGEKTVVLGAGEHAVISEGEWLTMQAKMAALALS